MSADVHAQKSFDHVQYQFTLRKSYVDAVPLKTFGKSRHRTFKKRLVKVDAVPLKNV